MLDLCDLLVDLLARRFKTLKVVERLGVLCLGRVEGLLESSLLVVVCTLESDRSSLNVGSSLLETAVGVEDVCARRLLLVKQMLWNERAVSRRLLLVDRTQRRLLVDDDEATGGSERDGVRVGVRNGGSRRMVNSEVLPNY